VGLIIYGYDDDQGRSERWKIHLGKLRRLRKNEPSETSWDTCPKTSV